MKQPPTASFFHSLVFKLYSAVALCVVSLLLVNLLLNNVAFSDHYQNEKQQLLEDTYHTLNACANDSRQLAAFLSDRPSEPAILLWDEHRILCRDQAIPLPDGNSLFPVLMPLDMPSGSYTVYDRPSRTQPNDDSLTLYGRTQTGLNVILQISLADMADNRRILNRFWLWSSVIALLLGGGLVWWLSRTVMRPITRLSSITHRMAQQQFDDRYPQGGRDELAMLGSDLNRVSETMETTLAQLKTANASLLSEAENKERQSDSRRTFISNVSHELKTPIALIQTYAEGLKEQVAGNEEERAFYCDVISDEAGRLSQMITRMTMLMQLESGKEELQIDRFSMKAVCEHLLERYAPLFAERQVTTPSLPADDGFVWGDASLIEHVLTNYLTNALNHVNIGGEIRIDWIINDGRARIRVFNSGSHIPEDELDRIWDSFYKVDKARTRAYGGSGIGLSVAAAIMRVHRMPYGVSNTETGVEFYFELPVQ